MKTKSAFRLIILFIVNILLISCGGSSSGGSSSGDSTERIVSAEFTDSTLYSSRTAELNYEVEADLSVEEWTVSFYLENADDPSELYYLETEYHEHLSSEHITSANFDVKISKDIPTGDYYLKGHIEEMPDDTADFISATPYRVDNSLNDVSNVKITHIELVEDTIVVDLSDDKDISDLHAELDVDHIDEIRQGMIPAHDINANATVEIEGPLPEGDIELSFELSIDDGTTWMPVDVWNNSEQAYSDHIDITFPGYDEGAYSQHVVILANISAAQYQEIYDEYTGNLNDFADSLEYATHFLARKKITIAGVPEDDDDSYHFNLSLYPMTPDAVDESGDVADATAESRYRFPNGSYATAVEYEYESKSFDIGNDNIKIKPSVYATYKYINKGQTGGGFNTQSYSSGAEYSTGFYGHIVVFGKSIELTSAHITVSTAYDPTFSGVSTDIEFFDADLYSFNEYWRTYHAISFSKSWNKSKEIASKTYYAGVVPIRIHATADGKIESNVTLSYSSTSAGVTNSKLPNTQFDIVVSGGPSIGIGEFGVTSDFLIFDNTLTATATLYVEYANELISGGGYNVGVSDHLKAISGKLGLFARWGKHGKTWWIYNTPTLLDHTYTLFSDHGSL